MEEGKKFSLRYIVACSVIGFLGGLVMGFLLAPIKKGMTIGCNNGNYYGPKEELEEMREDLEMEMSELR